MDSPNNEAPHNSAQESQGAAPVHDSIGSDAPFPNPEMSAEFLQRRCLTARLIQVHFSFYRAGAALLTRVPREELGGEAIKIAEVDEHDCREFSDPAEAVAFTLATIAEGEAIGIGWSPDEMDTFHALAEFAGMLAEADQVVTMIGPRAATFLLSRDNLPQAAAVMGTALLLGLRMIIEEVE